MSLMLNNITVRTIRMICKDYDDLFEKSVRSYYSISPYVIGKLDCFWMDEDYFSCFENYYMIIIVIYPCQEMGAYHSYVWEQNTENFLKDPGKNYLT